MSRILQIRRGTSAQNDNFTGLAGEITMDTTNKTLRIHDGQKLGGYTVARADQVNTSDFDITTVSDDFWRNMINRIAPGISYTDGNPTVIGTGAYTEYLFPDTPSALFAQAILICINSDAGYNTGDEIMSFGIGDAPVLPPYVFRDSNGVHIRMFVGGENIWVPHKNSGKQIFVSRNNWRVKFRLYC